MKLNLATVACANVTMLRCVTAICLWKIIEKSVMRESFVFCPARLDSRRNSRYLVLDSRFAQEWRIANRVENRDSQRTVSLLLNGSVPPLGLAGDPLLDLHTDIIILYTVRKPLLIIVMFKLFIQTLPLCRISPFCLPVPGRVCYWMSYVNRHNIILTNLGKWRKSSESISLVSVIAYCNCF